MFIYASLSEHLFLLLLLIKNPLIWRGVFYEHFLEVLNEY